MAGPFGFLVWASEEVERKAEEVARLSALLGEYDNLAEGVEATLSAKGQEGVTQTGVFRALQYQTYTEQERFDDAKAVAQQSIEELSPYELKVFLSFADLDGGPIDAIELANGEPFEANACLTHLDETVEELMIEAEEGKALIPSLKLMSSLVLPSMGIDTCPQLRR